MYDGFVIQVWHSYDGKIFPFLGVNRPHFLTHFFVQELILNYNYLKINIIKRSFVP
jgi:hypothetical protein